MATTRTIVSLSFFVLLSLVAPQAQAQRPCAGAAAESTQAPEPQTSTPDKR